MSPALLQLIGLVVVILGTVWLVGWIASKALVRILHTAFDIHAFIKFKREYREVMKAAKADEELK